jgi:FtsP/CotA-like multicopper oxidase with cupredoxin domain
MTSSNIALVFVPIAIACGQNVADPPAAQSPVRLSAVNDPLTGRTAFLFEGRHEPPVIRANPGSSVDITYRNEMSPNNYSKCATGPCMNMTNLHFHGLSRRMRRRTTSCR